MYNPDTDTITIKGQLPESEVLDAKNLTNNIATSAQTTAVENVWAATGVITIFLDVGVRIGPPAERL